MPRYRYRARSSSGDLQEGVVDAPSSDLAAGQLSANGLVPISLKEEDEQAGAGFEWKDLFEPKVKQEDLILFARQMYTLVKSGVPIIRALRGLVEHTRNTRLRKALDAVRGGLEGGRDLSAAMMQQEQVFPVLFSSIVQVGEGTGRLDESFQQIGGYLERDRELRKKIKSALRYPAFVTIAVAVAISVISLFVIPAFEKLFASMGGELPLPTRIIMGTSHLFSNYWPHMLVALVGCAFLFRQSLKTDRGRLNWDRLLLRLPLVGDIVIRATLARFSRAFSMGYSSGIPLVQALVLAGRAVGNRYMESKVVELQAGIERGETLTQAAFATEMFTPLVLQMMSVGEESGAVDQMLIEVAEYYEREVEYDLNNLSAVIEPIMIVIMGAMVLVLALGVFLPMWEMASLAR